MLIIKTPENVIRRSGVFIVNFEHITPFYIIQLFLKFPLLTSNELISYDSRFPQVEKILQNGCEEIQLVNLLTEA